MGTLGLLIGVDILVVVGLTVVIGASAPRWSTARLQRDTGPLRLVAAETAGHYRRIGVPRLARLLPEAGGAFGGESKRVLPGSSAMQLSDYLVEVRRAEWVHWLSMATVLPLLVFNPWWLWVFFAVVVVVVNGVFIAILRFNRLRLLAILERSAG